MLLVRPFNRVSPPPAPPPNNRRFFSDSLRFLVRSFYLPLNVYNSTWTDRPSFRSHLRMFSRRPDAAPEPISRYLRLQSLLKIGRSETRIVRYTVGSRQLDRYLRSKRNLADIFSYRPSRRLGGADTVVRPEFLQSPTEGDYRIPVLTAVRSRSLAKGHLKLVSWARFP